MRQGWGGSLALITQLGVTVVVSTLLGLVLGLWVDAHFGTRPWGTLVFSLVGILVGSAGVYRLIVTSIDEAVAERKGPTGDDPDRLNQ
jgi:F0F1-type ATP synthase assembly protein I